LNKIANFPDLAQARNQAAEWVARLDRGLSAEEQVEFQKWHRGPVNSQAFQELSTLWSELDVMQVLADVSPRPATLDSSGSRRSRVFVGAVAAALVGALIAVPTWHWLQQRSQPIARDTSAGSRVEAFATAVGERREMQLSDGSTLSLNTNSLVEVAMADNRRNLTLVRGEALFNVAHDASRPFRVKVGDRIVQAVGTAFDVRVYSAGDLEVIVTNGIVNVLPAAEAPDAAPTPIASGLGKGEVLRIDDSGSQSRIRLEDDALAARLSWRTGALVFNGETLARALEEFSRYTRDRFVIDDPELRNLRIGGYFPVGDTAALLEALGAGFGLESTRSPDGTVHISREQLQDAASNP
jgi:transmembrane sensor